METNTDLLIAADIFAREITNGIWFCINLSCLFIFFRYTWLSLAANRSWFAIGRMVRDRSFVPEMQASIGLTIYFIGATLRAAYVWWLLKAQTRGWPIAEVIEDGYWLMYLAAAFAIVGGLCTLRVFTKLNYGHRAWILAGIFSIIVPVITHFEPVWGMLGSAVLVPLALYFLL